MRSAPGGPPLSVRVLEGPARTGTWETFHRPQLPRSCPRAQRVAVSALSRPVYPALSDDRHLAPSPREGRDQAQKSATWHWPSRPPLPRASPRAWPAFTRRGHRAGRCPRPPPPCPRHADRRRRTELGPFSQSGDSSAALGPALPARALFLVTKSEMLKTPLGTFRLGCDPARG